MNSRPYSPILTIAAIPILIFMIAPVIVIVYSSFLPSGAWSFPPAGLTLKWFANFFASARFMDALVHSLLLTLLVTPVTLIIAVPTSIALVRRRFPGSAFLNALILSPLVIPGVINGVAFLNFFAWAGIISGFWKIAIALICITLPFAVRAIVATLEGINPAYEEAARNLGAGPLATFWSVTLPQLRPGLVAGGIFVFVEAIDNFSVVVFLTDIRTSVLPVEAYGYIRDFDDPTVSAMATILILQSLVMVLLLKRFAGFERVLQSRG